MSERARGWVGAAVTLALAAVVVVGIAIGEPSQDDRVRSLGARIKCPVCQGEPILDSPSETARAMMEIVAEQVAAGQSDDEIVAYFTERYGDGILLDPPVGGRTLVLWLLPFAALAAGVLLILGRRRKDRPGGAS